MEEGGWLLDSMGSASATAVSGSGVDNETIAGLGPLFTKELIPSSFVAFIAATLCSGVGIGGGAFYIATYIFNSMNVHLAVPLSKMTILGTAIGGLFVNFTRRHPNADIPLIDYEASLLMEPMTLIGTIFGVLLNVTFPATVILVCLILLLTFTTYKTFQSGLAAYRKEQAEIAARALTVNEGSGESLLGNKTTEGLHDMELTSGEFPNEELEAIKARERKTFRADLLGAMLVIWLFFIFYTLATDSADGTSVMNVKCGSGAWIGIMIATIIILFACASFLTRRLILLHQRKVELGYYYADGVTQWTKNKTLTMAFSSVVAGTAAAFLGIGGGMVQGPLMIHFKFQPAVSAATAAFMILYTASSSSAQYFVLGRLRYDWGLWFLGIGMLGAIVGHIAVGWLVKKYKRPYLITFLLAFLIFISMGAFIWLSVNQIKHLTHFGFQGPCDQYHG